MAEVYEKAKARGAELERKRWVQLLFEYSFYTMLLAFIYFVLVGMPLWKGAVYWLYWVVSTKFVIAGGWSITIGVAFFYAFGPLFLLFEKEPPIVERPANFDRNEIPGVKSTALLVPCYKSANIIGPTLEAALKIFPPSHIFVIANGNSKTPLDNTEEVCRPYGVNHIWSPVGSKIVAQFVGCYAAKGFQNVLLIDDDCALPSNFPVVSDRLGGKVTSIGYTIKSVGPNSSKGTWCQQAQDLEYKLSGLQRALAGKMGSATFPHGAISLWDRKFLIKTFHDHPGFSVSEDWFFGHSCRRLGGRIKMCTSVFVETETPDAIFFSSGGSRGGFGEMTVFKQRFLRWNFFFVNGMWYNLGYIFGSWKLGFWEIGAKLFVFQEVYETLLYLFTPFILPISFYVEASFCGYLLLGTVVMYLISVLIFNELHLRLRKERISWTVMLVYYMPYKLILTLINVGSCYWSLFKYAQYFAKRHPKVIEDEKAVEVVMRLEEEVPAQKPVAHAAQKPFENLEDEVRPSQDQGGRRMFVTALAQRPSVRGNHNRSVLPTIQASAVNTPSRLSFDVGAEQYFSPDPTHPDPAFKAQREPHDANSGAHDQSEPARKSPSIYESASMHMGRRKTSWSESFV
ncbi:glycosyl transferase [Xylariaceae sp. FL0016]|nr:glycosyl transferase [Xylariaceae sp. FL0016]